MYPNGFRHGLLKEPYVPDNGYITLSDKPGFGVELVDHPEKAFPHVPGPGVLANPRFLAVIDCIQGAKRAIQRREPTSILFRNARGRGQFF